MKLTREQIVHIALLARLGLSEDEIKKFEVQLSNILENFEVLQKVDTSHVAPTAQTLPLTDVYREDKPAPSFPREDILKNAPMSEGDSFKVRPVLGE